MSCSECGTSNAYPSWFFRMASVAMVAGIGYCSTGFAQWQPEKNIEIIVPTSPGGGLDQFGRLIQKLVRDQRLVPGTTSVVNKAGGGGLIGFNYLNQYAADGHYLIVHTPTLLTNYILGKGNISHRDVTPLAELYSEYIVIMVRTESPLRNGNDLIQELKKNPAGLSIGIATSLGNHNHTGVALPLKAAGINVRSLKTVIFGSVADCTTALLGGHIDIVPTPPGNVVHLASGGKVRGIAISGPTRIPGPFADVPTWKELGIDIVFTTTRNIAGPKGIAPDRVAFWDNVFQSMVQSSEWTKNLEKRSLNNTFRKSAETERHLQAQYDELKEVLTDLGLVKAK